MKILGLLLLLLLASCYKEVNVNIPSHDIKPVVSCVFNPDSLFKVKINTTQGILDNKNTEITEGTLHLYENDVLIDTLNYNNSSFISDVKPKTNTKYSIKIKTPYFLNIETRDFLPKKPIVNPMFFIDSVSKYSNGDMISQAKIKITDNSPEKNYYEIILKGKVINPSIHESPIKYVFYDTNNDLVLVNEELLEYYPSELLFSDKLFNNKTYTLSINYRVAFTLGINNKPDEKPYNLIVTVRSVSENYYNYKKTLIKHYNNQEQDIWYGLGAPIPMFTNIENGYGIFAGYNQITDTIYKKK